jgi:predicted Zn-dependent protease
MKKTLKIISIFSIFFIISCDHNKKNKYTILTKQSDEKILGNIYHNIMIKKTKILPATSVSTKYINKIKNKIIKNNSYDNLDVNSYVFDSNLLSVFATVGEKIYFSTQVITSFTEREIYAVMCHEIGHVINRDSSKISSLMSLFNNIDVYRDKSKSIIIKNSIKKDRYYFDYIRKKKHQSEYEADLFAIGCLSRMGFDKTNLVSFLQKMKDQQNRITNFSRKRDTHPPINERIRRIMQFGDPCLAPKFCKVSD